MLGVEACLCLRAYVRACVCVFVYAFVCMCMCEYVYGYMSLCICVYACVHMYVSVCVYMSLCICVCLRVLHECRGSFYTSCVAGSRTKSLVLRAEQLVLRAQGGRGHTSEINNIPFDSKDSEADWGGQHPLPKCEDQVIASRAELVSLKVIAPCLRSHLPHSPHPTLNGAVMLAPRPPHLWPRHPPGLLLSLLLLSSVI